LTARSAGAGAQCRAEPVPGQPCEAVNVAAATDLGPNRIRTRLRLSYADSSSIISAAPCSQERGMATGESRGLVLVVEDAMADLE
jgi:hypothetical protein